MRLLLTFIIFILGVFYTFGKENCCEQCCEYLGFFCNKGKGKEEKKEENKEEKGKNEEGENENNEGEKKEEDKNEVQEEAKDLVNGNWLNKKNNIFLKIFNKNENEYKSGNITIKLVKEDNDKTKIANLEEVEEKLKTNKHTWALFEIIYKEKKEEGEVGKMVYLYCSDIENSENNGIFDSCQQHVSISVIACDTSNVTNMSFMFYDCSSLTELDLKNFNTETITGMCSMFSGCAYLQQLDLTNFNTDNVKDMDNMFYGCSSLTKLNLSNFNTKNVTDMEYMFISCDSLQTVTSNNDLDPKIIQQLENLGQWNKNQEDNKFVWTKNQ